MGGLSIWHLVIILAVVVILFGGGGKLSKIMGDFGKGINAFKSGIKDEETKRREDDEARRLEEAKIIEHAAATRTADTARRENESAAR